MYNTLDDIVLGTTITRHYDGSTVSSTMATTVTTAATVALSEANSEDVDVVD